MSEPEAISLKDYTDMRHAGLIKLGVVALGSVIACTWVAFTLNAKAVGVAFSSNAREVETHNGTIRKWEAERGEREAKFATKADIAPLLKDYSERAGGQITATRFWGVIMFAIPVSIAAGGLAVKLFGLA